jgi:hypothetical protein
VEVKGYTGTVVFDGQSLTIVRSGMGVVTHGGRGQIRIPLSSVTTVMWKPANPLVNGYIHFSIPGSDAMPWALGIWVSVRGSGFW